MEQEQTKNNILCVYLILSRNLVYSLKQIAMAFK